MAASRDQQHRLLAQKQQARQKWAELLMTPSTGLLRCYVATTENDHAATFVSCCALLSAPILSFRCSVIAAIVSSLQCLLALQSAYAMCTSDAVTAMTS